MKRVCIHQPDFLPYLGFFQRLLISDVFIVHDDVQFMQRGWHHRDKIKTRHGERWLTLPVKKGHYRRNINQVEISKDDAVRFTKNLNFLKESYSKAFYFDKYFNKIKDIYLSDFIKMIDLNMAFLHFFFELFSHTNGTSSYLSNIHSFFLL